jgi:ATP-binding cassette subfamily C exporter for protease/lipase
MLNKIYHSPSVINQAMKRLSHILLWAVFFSILINVLTLSPTLYMLQLYDRVLISQNELTLVFISVIIVFLFLIQSFSEWLRSNFLIEFGLRLDHQLNSQIFHLIFDDYIVNKNQKVLNAFSDLTHLRQFLTGQGLIGLMDLPWTPIYILIIYFLNPSIGYLAILFATIQIALTIYSHKSIDKISNHLLESDKKNKNFIFAKLQNIDVVMSMGMLKNFKQKWLLSESDSQNIQTQFQQKNNKQKSIGKFVRYSMQSFTLGAAALFVIKGELSAASMIACNILMGRALQPIDLMVGSWKELKKAKSSYSNLNELLNDCSVKKILDYKVLNFKKLKIKKLSVQFKDTKQPLLKDINMTLTEGSVTAIMGASASGKTTLIRCILNLHQSYEGTIEIDNILINQLDRDHLGKSIGYLPQDIQLFDGTIAQNIARFSKIDNDKVIKASRLANIHDLILKLPRGYDTVIGEAGGTLSGGQKQRLALARALYGDPKLIMLDEPNSNLDEMGDLALSEALLKLKKSGAIIIIITHRVSILEIADKILTLKNGELTSEPLTRKLK